MRSVLILFFLQYTLLPLSISQIRLPKYISDGIVLQRQKPIKIWGYASPNEKVNITFLNQSFSAHANGDSIWSIILPQQQAGGPYKMDIQSSNNSTVAINNIMIGDVWVCSGQSNMETTMERLKDKYPDIYKNAFQPNIRQFYVPRNYDFSETKDDFQSGKWVEVTPNTISEFSGVAYFFAEEIYTSEKVPIGIINVALGGSPAQAWISEAGINQFPNYYKTLQLYKDKKYIDSIKLNNLENHKNWYTLINITDKGLQEKWYENSSDISQWKEINMPSYWKDNALPINAGTVWLRKSFTLSNDECKKNIRLLLGNIVDADSVYINGQYIGSTSYQYPPRKYYIPSKILKAGENNITIRVIDENGKGGFVKDKTYGLLFESGSFIDLSGKWLYRIGTSIEKIQPNVFIQWKPSGLYNAMLSPLFHYSVKGVLWYQGESNTNNPSEYFSLMNELIKNWRSGWHNEYLPFYYVQLANFMEAKKEPTESKWAELRQQQLALRKIQNTGMAVAIDIGEWNDIHPLNKKDVGKRLALHALKNDYQHTDIVSEGPIIKSATISNGQVILEFFNVEQGIKEQENLTHFEIAGNDKKFIKCLAYTKGNTIIIQDKNVNNPKYVRYAWADNPENVNFYNHEGLPASPFEISLE